MSTFQAEGELYITSVYLLNWSISNQIQYSSGDKDYIFDIHVQRNYCIFKYKLYWKSFINI